MSDLIEIIIATLFILFVIAVADFMFYPAEAQQQAIIIINAVANTIHAAECAFH